MYCTKCPPWPSSSVSSVKPVYYIFILFYLRQGVYAFTLFVFLFVCLLEYIQPILTIFSEKVVQGPRNNLHVLHFGGHVDHATLGLGFV